MPPQRRLSWVSQSGAAIVAPAPSLLAMAASSESLVTANSMLSMSSSDQVSVVTGSGSWMEALTRGIILGLLVVFTTVALDLTERTERPPRRARRAMSADAGAESATAPCILSLFADCSALT